MLRIPTTQPEADARMNAATPVSQPITPTLPRPVLTADRLAGRTVDLERLDLDRHAPGLWDAIGRHADLWEHIPGGPFADADVFTQWLRDRIPRPGQTIYAVMDKTDTVPTPAGVLILLNANPDMGTVEMGLVYGARLSRRVTGTEGVFLLIDYALGQSGYRRLEWRCGPPNVASIRAATRYGFTHEGLLRQTLWMKGRNWDTNVFSILDGEWPARRQRLAAWLAPENFTEDGHQRQPLTAFGDV
ncbi:GNAT family N-acetyltransferase [Nitrospirillum iridis]|uniref:RimJ/RimL family protein N-acetyltransferase n=1 Tax=Nitrospirillum iridis TaxID=765888 RepID=A0A7X0EE47_9PROT|nr:GNAT family protein [Nitrospirillum iridis]MBB6251671.1 RimJ/RimL family protein N-acetyltransferase [Nitrospirillum iridis]